MSSPIRCISSQLMTPLLTWRNPQGSEDGWIRTQPTHPNQATLVVTSIALASLTVLSIAETVTYASLTILSLVVYPVTATPFEYSAKLLESSSFTVLWTFVDGIFANSFFPDLLTHESFARFWGGQFNPIPISLLRVEDYIYLTEWFARHELPSENPVLVPIIAAGRATEEIINNGVKFIKEDVLAGASSKTLDQVKEWDPEIFIFVLTKAIFIYTLGSKRNEEHIPDFFKVETQGGIEKLRKEIVEEGIAQEIERILSNPEQFEAKVENDKVREVLIKLKNIASGELQQSLLISKIWQVVIEELSKEKEYIYADNTFKRQKAEKELVYKKEEKIGSGQGAEIFVLRPSEGSSRSKALKVSKPEDKEQSKNELKVFKSEIDWKGVKNVVVPKAIFEEEGTVQMVLPLFKGSVSNIVTELTDEEQIEAITQIIEGALEIRNRRIDHLEINLDNILYREKGGKKHFAITDFGCSVTNSANEFATLQGLKGTLRAILLREDTSHIAGPIEPGKISPLLEIFNNVMFKECKSVKEVHELWRKTLKDLK